MPSALKNQTSQDQENEYEAMPIGFAQKTATLYGLQFFYVGLFIPYFPVWLKSKALDSTQISIILSIALAARVLTSGQIISFADRYGERSTILIWCYFLSFFSILLFLPTGNFWQIFFVAILFNVFFNPVLPIIDAISLSGVRRFGADYGKIRIWGSITFIAANFGGGLLLADFDPQFILYIMILFVGLGAIFSLWMPKIGRRTKTREPMSAFGDVSLWRQPIFLCILTAAGLSQASHAMMYGFGSIYWQSLAFSGYFIGVLWAVGVVAEIFFFQYFKKLIEFTSATNWILIGCVSGIVRWALFPLVESQELYFVLQILHGLTFGAVHIATMHFIMKSVGEERLGNAQGVFFVLSGVFMGLGVLISGPVFDRFGVDAFYLMSALCAVAILFVIAAKQFSPKDLDEVG